MRERRLASVDNMLKLLRSYMDRDQILLGHQNAGHIGISIDVHDGTDSDVKRITGRMPAVVGIDTLSFLGYEGKMHDLIKIVKNLHKEGCIITLSSHMPNFSLGGPDTFYDYSPNNTADSCGRRIMPGGDLNAKYLKFLDMIVEFTGQCVDVHGEMIPMIFRPFHECNGDWFWWGRPHITDSEYIELFRYTVSYLEEHGVTSFAYCYSPNGPLIDSDDFMARYPGDDLIDIIGIDFYHDRPADGDGYTGMLDSSLTSLCSIADSHGIIPAVTEIGLRMLDSGICYYEGLAPSGNPQHWFTSTGEVVSHHKIAYMLFWANFSDSQHWIPYIKGDVRHEMTDDFIAFASSPSIVLAPAFDIG